jgi:hypothetical protein
MIGTLLQTIHCKCTEFNLLWLIIICATVLGFNASCGIESLPYLNPPDRMDFTSDIYAIQFSNGSAIDNDTDYFDGYELVYRFYDPIVDEAVLEDESVLVERSKYLTGINLTYLFNREYSRLSYSSDQHAVLYRRMNSVNEITRGSFSRPLVNLSESGKSQYKNAPCVYTIDFASVFFQTSEHCRISFPDPQNYFYATFSRYVQTAGGEYELKTFLPEDLEEGDDDLPESLYDSEREFPAEEVTIVLYAASFGRDEDFSSLYSEAVYLGSIELPLISYY